MMLIDTHQLLHPTAGTEVSKPAEEESRRGLQKTSQGGVYRRKVKERFTKDKSRRGLQKTSQGAVYRGEVKEGITPP